MLTNFFCCATHSGPIFHTVSYAISCGIPLIAAVSIYSVEGLAGMGGRVAFGILGDRVPSTFWLEVCCSRPSGRSPISSCVTLARFTPWRRCLALSMPV
jgi:hypothetical protein